MPPPPVPGPDEPTSTLLVRRVSTPVDRALFVLADVAAGPDDRPVGIAEFDLDRRKRVALVRRVEVTEARRREGLGRRLVHGAAVLLRADGVECLEADAGTEVTTFLSSVGFSRVPDRGGILVYWL